MGTHYRQDGKTSASYKGDYKTGYKGDFAYLRQKHLALFSNPRLPTFPELLLARKRMWESGTLNEDQVMIWAAALLCFFGFLRSGEVCVPGIRAYDQGAHLSFQDVVVDNVSNPQSIQV